MKKEKNSFRWPLIGNKQISDYLSKCIANNNVGGAYIFNGPDNLGKTTLAFYFAKILLCEKLSIANILPCDKCRSCFNLGNKTAQTQDQDSLSEVKSIHSDLHIVKKEKDKKNISVEQVRNLIRVMNLSSFLNSYKIGIVKHADKLSQEAANALLKTLEEPKQKVVLILIAQNIDVLPQTIKSRCQILNFKPVSSDIIYDYLIDNHQAKRSEAKDLSRMCLGRPALAVKFFENKDFYDSYIEKVNVFVDFFNQNIIERIISLDGIFDKKLKGQEAVVISNRILEVWEGVIRDCILSANGLVNLIQHQNKIEQFKSIKFNLQFKLSNFLKIFKDIQDAKSRLNDNVSPKLVLESVVINI